jgi:hypothetical protein
LPKIAAVEVEIRKMERKRNVRNYGRLKERFLS